jgi:hypothetical protein
MVNWTRERVAWMAGIFEGEGCISTYDGGVILTVKMTDEDVIRRFGECAGIGAVNGPYTDPRLPNFKPTWAWRCNRSAKSYALLVAMWPYLCSRRRSKMEAAISALKLHGPISGRVHGTSASYKQGCRCDGCKAGRRAYLGERTQARRAASTPDMTMDGGYG